MEQKVKGKPRGFNGGRKKKFNEKTIMLQRTIPARLKDELTVLIDNYCKANPPQ